MAQELGVSRPTMDKILKRNDLLAHKDNSDETQTMAA